MSQVVAVGGEAGAVLCAATALGLSLLPAHLAYKDHFVDDDEHPDTSSSSSPSSSGYNNAKKKGGHSHGAANSDNGNSNGKDYTASSSLSLMHGTASSTPVMVPHPPCGVRAWKRVGLGPVLVAPSLPWLLYTTLAMQMLATFVSLVFNNYLFAECVRVRARLCLCVAVAVAVSIRVSVWCLCLVSVCLPCFCVLPSRGEAMKRLCLP